MKSVKKSWSFGSSVKRPLIALWVLVVFRTCALKRVETHERHAARGQLYQRHQTHRKWRRVWFYAEVVTSAVVNLYQPLNS